MGMEKKYGSMLLMLGLMFCSAGCSVWSMEERISERQTQESEIEYIVVGFSQIGAESDWRSANTDSMRATFSRENGYELLYEDGQQKQVNQIRAIRTFIQRGVDYIVLAPVIESGWDTVLTEAKDAGIPVIIVDRMVDVSDESLYTAWVGSDSFLEGEKVGEWINQFLQKNKILNANIVNIQGTVGATAQIGRTKGLRQACQKNDNMTLLAEVSGDFTQAKGREVMESLLKSYQDIDIAYCENDNEAFGAIEAIETAGKTVGTDIEEGEIMVVSFDGVNEDALHYVLENKITCIAECNPVQGPRVRTVIEALEEGRTVQKTSFVTGKLYTHDNQVEAVMVDSIEYPVTVVTEKVIREREY